MLTDIVADPTAAVGCLILAGMSTILVLLAVSIVRAHRERDS